MSTPISAAWAVHARRHPAWPERTVASLSWKTATERKPEEGACGTNSCLKTLPAVHSICNCFCIHSSSGRIPFPILVQLSDLTVDAWQFRSSAKGIERIRQHHENSIRNQEQTAHPSFDRCGKSGQRKHDHHQAWNNEKR